MEVEGSEKQSSYSWLACCNKCLPLCSSSSSSGVPPPSPDSELSGKHGDVAYSSKPARRKPGGWKAMPYVLGNETFERLATIGLLANFMVFLLTVFHMEQASAANLLNIWSGVGNFAPLLGAFVSDAYIGRFWTIGFSSFASLLYVCALPPIVWLTYKYMVKKALETPRDGALITLNNHSLAKLLWGMVTLTLIAWIPQLRPPPCTPHQLQIHQCEGPTSSQLGILILALGFLSIGTGGIRPCSLPFGVDQFDPTTEEGRKGINSFFNWYYTTFTVVLIFALTVMVYIQDNISWVWGFGIPTLFMLGSIVLFFFGTRLYVYVKPEGSVFSGIAQALVASYKKRRLTLLADDEKRAFYDPPPAGTTVTKLPLTYQLRFLNKAAIIMDGEVKPDGFRSNPWTLCSIQQIEEVKCLLKIVPIWASGIICFTSMVQQVTFTISQALKTDRHLGPNFQIPSGSLMVISMITVGLWVPFYDRVLVPALRKVTKLDSGITLLQRIGIGIVFSISSMVVAGLVEKMRRDSAISHGRQDGIAPISVMWLAPQLILMGFAEAFNFIGQIEFYYKEFPEYMRSVANSLFFVTVAGASYLSSVLVTVLHGVTGRHGRPDWLTNDINEGRVDYFYYIIAGMGVLNLGYFLIVSQRYHYKGTTVEVIKEEKTLVDVELNAIKQ